ncbi:MAG TPA: hypothetical protein VK866_10650 [Acidimicrobiales bacterium]|nr:hypothetical protein [Acidimicrobiales bacterium]
MITLEAGTSLVQIDPAAGGRITVAQLSGHDVLVGERAGAFSWGSFVMAPFAGRVRRGALRVDGRDHTLAPGMGPHAIHGTVVHRRWEVEHVGPGEDAVSEVRLGTALGSDWPWAGRVHQRIALAADRLDLTVEVCSDGEAFPASCGWHPWFRRRLAPEAPPVELHVRPRAMLRRDAEGLPSGELVAPTEGPWDDCMVGLDGPPRLVWPGALELELSSPVEHWVLYTEPAEALCVEPQTAPPDPFAGPCAVVTPGAPLTASFTWRWRDLGAEPGAT